jgi:hypothetical protein
VFAGNRAGGNQQLAGHRRLAAGNLSLCFLV